MPWQTATVPQTDESREFDWLIADIGGTHARLARWDPRAGVFDAVRFANDEYPSPEHLLRDYAARFERPPRRAALALAMPVDRDSVRLTNRPWVFSAHLLAALDWVELRLANDFVAAAAGVEALPASAFEPVCGPGDMQDTVRVVLGPGTGLGAAAVIASSGPPFIIASEAGHLTFAPGADRTLFEAAQLKWPRVSWERIVCGAGLAWIDALERQIDPPLAPAQVAQRAREGEACAQRAVARFSRMLGEFAGDLCLAFAAFGGVSLCGGVLEGLGLAFNHTEFAAGFTDKGRFAERMRGVTCRRLSGHDIGVLGLAHYLSGGCVIPVKRWQRSDSLK